jgi:predicted naringenin-chalcone synthase
MSSATILFVLKEIMESKPLGNIFAAAFGPGLTVETFIAGT